MSWKINKIEIENFKFFKNIFPINVDRKTSCFMVRMVLVKVPFIGAFILISKRMQKVALKLRNIS